MKLLSLFISASLLAIGSFGRKQASIDRFEELHTKLLSSSPAKLTTSSYGLWTGLPRDYSTAVLLTAMDARFGCQLCQQFQPEFDVLSKSWVKGDKAGKSRTLFGVLDFADGRDVFISLGLQTAPVLLLFPPTEGPHAAASPDPIRYDFATGSPSAEHVQAWLARHLPDRPHPPIKRPINWMRWIIGTASFIISVTVILTASPYILPLLQNRNIWASISLIAILLFTSGHMFNHIRKVPYIAGDGKGGINYFAGSFQNQFGLETQVIAAIYGTLAFCAISLAVKVPRIADHRTQQIAVLAWGGVLFILYSFLLSIFRIKNGGYPFSLPPFM